MPSMAACTGGELSAGVLLPQAVVVVEVLGVDAAYYGQSGRRSIGGLHDEVPLTLTAEERVFLSRLLESALREAGKPTSPPLR
jgi:hypothetical protein